MSEAFETAREASTWPDQKVHFLYYPTGRIENIEFWYLFANPNKGVLTAYSPEEIVIACLLYHWMSHGE